VGTYDLCWHFGQQTVIVLHGKTMRVTRSIKRIFLDVSQHLFAYQQVLVCSWMCEGAVGTRLKPGLSKPLRPDTGQDLDLKDEAAYDPEDILGFDLPDETPLALLAPAGHLSGSGISTGDSVPTQSQPPENTATGMVSTGDVSMGASVSNEQDVIEERSAKADSEQDWTIPISSC